MPYGDDPRSNGAVDSSEVALQERCHRAARRHVAVGAQHNHVDAPHVVRVPQRLQVAISKGDRLREPRLCRCSCGYENVRLRS